MGTEFFDDLQLIRYERPDWMNPLAYQPLRLTSNAELFA